MDVTESARPNAFSTLAATLIAPQEAFAAIQEQPQWRWALAVTIGLAALGTVLITPASRHVMEAVSAAQLANDPHLAGLPPAQAAAEAQRAAALTASIANFLWLLEIIVVPIIVLVEAAIIFGVRTLAGSTETFAQIFSLTAHVQFIGIGIGTLIVGVVVALHPSTSFHAQTDFVNAIPTAAWLVPGAGTKLLTFLSSLTPFSIWATVVLALGLVSIAAFSRAVAWTTAIALLCLGGAWAAAFAR